MMLLPDIAKGPEVGISLQLCVGYVHSKSELQIQLVPANDFYSLVHLIASWQAHSQIVGFSKFRGLQSTQTFKHRWNFSRCSGNSPCFPSWDMYIKEVRKANLWFLCTGIIEKTYYGMELLLLWSNPWSWGILNSFDTQLIFIDPTLSNSEWFRLKQTLGGSKQAEMW